MAWGLANYRQLLDGNAADAYNGIVHVVSEIWEEGARKGHLLHTW